MEALVGNAGYCGEVQVNGGKRKSKCWALRWYGARRVRVLGIRVL